MKGGITRLATCWGCEESSLQYMVKLKDKFDMVYLPQIEETEIDKFKKVKLDFLIVSGAVVLKKQEEILIKLREKTDLVIAYGTCAYLGGILGFLNIEGNNVKAVDQVIDVNYYIPGCPPPENLLREAIESVIMKKLPENKKVFGSIKVLCEECELNKTKPDKGIKIKEIKDIWDSDMIDEEKCLLLQGYLCLGPVTRGGCGAACIKGEFKSKSFPKTLLAKVLNRGEKLRIPCTGCFGPLESVRDFGASALSFVASLIDSNKEEEIKKIIEKGIPNPLSLFYLYSLAKSIIFGKEKD
jgi:F420-non-reducing hydrogenase small subunit